MYASIGVVLITFWLLAVVVFGIKFDVVHLLLLVGIAAFVVQLANDHRKE